jgi:predicted transposase YbfD/YdcC
LEEEAWLRTFLALPNGIPSHDTFNRIFRMINVGAFNACFLEWVKALCKKVSRDVVAIDGKTLRASGDEEQSPLHMVSAWSVANRMVLGQRSVDTKSNEITAIPKLLQVLELTGCIVTIDAMGCQKDIAKAIVARKADYVLAVKANQEGLHQAMQALFARLDAGESLAHATSDSTETGHGRTAHRKVTTMDAVRVLPEHILFAWPKLETLVRIQSETQREGKAGQTHDPCINRHKHLCTNHLYFVLVSAMTVHGGCHGCEIEEPALSPRFPARPTRDEGPAASASRCAGDWGSGNAVWRG